MKDSIKLIEMFEPIKFDEKLCDLKTPEVRFNLYSLQDEGDSGYIFGRQIADYRLPTFGKAYSEEKERPNSWHFKYDLINRPYLGPTSLKHELAFLMVNQA